MKKHEIKELLQSVFIETPCSVSWDSMTGDDKVRLCSQCNLNVHNLSNMSDEEAALVLQRRKTERSPGEPQRRRRNTWLKAKRRSLNDRRLSNFASRFT